MVGQALGRVKRRDGSPREVPDPARLLHLNSLVQPEPVVPATADSNERPAGSPTDSTPEQRLESGDFSENIQQVRHFSSRSF